MSRLCTIRSNPYFVMWIRCSIVRLDQTCIFPHRHAFFTPGVPMDAAYKAQNRQEAYNTGAAILAQRRQNGFTDVDMLSIPPPLPPLLPSPPLHSPGVNSPFVSVASASLSLGFHVYSK